MKRLDERQKRVEELLEVDREKVQRLSRQLRETWELLACARDRVDYLDLAEAIEAKTNRAKEWIGSRPLDAARELLSLDWQDARFEQWKHLQTVALSRWEYLRPLLKDQLTFILKDLLQKCNWPKKPGDDVSDDMLQEIRDVIALLIDLQGSLIRHQEFLSWPVEVLSEPIIERFRFHFSGDKDTNQLEHPEYLTSFLTSMLHDNISFLDSVFNAKLHSIRLVVDLRIQFVWVLSCCLSQSLFERCRVIIGFGEKGYHLITKTVDESFRFIQESSALIGGSVVPSLPLHELFEDKSLSEQWINAEKSLCQAQMDAILDVLGNLDSAASCSSSSDAWTHVLNSSLEKCSRLPNSNLANCFLEAIIHRVVAVFVDSILETSHSNMRFLLKSGSKSIHQQRGKLAFQRFIRALNTLLHAKEILEDIQVSVFFLELQKLVSDKQDLPLFTSQISFLEERLSDGLGKVVEYCTSCFMKELLSRWSNYKNVDPSQHTLDVSEAFLEACVIIKEQTCTLDSIMVPFLKQKLFSCLFTELSQKLYRNLIIPAKLGRTSLLQLLTDMDLLCKSVGQLSNCTISSFPEIRDSINILTLPNAMKEKLFLLIRSSLDSERDLLQAKSILEKQFGILILNIEEVYDLLLRLMSQT